MALVEPTLTSRSLTPRRCCRLCPPPIVSPAAIVLMPLQAVYRNTHLKTEIFLIRDVRLVNQIHITDGYGLQRFGAQNRGWGSQFGLLDGLTFG